MTPLSAIAPAGAAAGTPGGADQAKLREVAKQFEAVFARQLIGSMRAGKLGDDMLQSDAGDQFRDMADARIADDLASKGSLGIADMLVKQLGAKDRTQAAAAPAVTRPATPAAAPAAPK